MTAYYNEHDPLAAAWLRELMADGLIAPGEVDTRSIAEVQPEELNGFSQCHFFAGIGTFSYALRRAGWSDDRPIWTGSAPCQPFSSAGKGEGHDDERHLWPEFYRLIRACRPGTVIGEQVASSAVIGAVGKARRGVPAADGGAWLDLIFDDMEAARYACGAVVIPACGIGAPHIRQRLYWVADAGYAERRTDGAGRHDANGAQAGREQGARDSGTSGDVSVLADDECGGRDSGRQRSQRDDTALPAERLRRIGGLGDRALSRSGAFDRQSSAGDQQPWPAGRPSIPGGLGDAGGAGLPIRQREAGIGTREGEERRTITQPSATSGFWGDAAWIPCRDGKWRPVPRATEPGTEPGADDAAGGLGLVRDAAGHAYHHPLIQGAKDRTMRLRGYGNAVVAEQAQAFIEAVMELKGEADE